MSTVEIDIISFTKSALGNMECTKLICDSISNKIIFENFWTVRMSNVQGKTFCSILTFSKPDYSHMSLPFSLDAVLKIIPLYSGTSVHRTCFIADTSQ